MGEDRGYRLWNQLANILKIDVTSLRTRLLPFGQREIGRSGVTSAWKASSGGEEFNTPKTSIPLGRTGPGLVLCGLSLVALYAQTQTFDVVSVKLNRSLGETSIERTTRGRFTATNVTIGELIQFAFGVREFQVSGGPGWLHTDRFDVLATTGSPIDLDDKLVEPYLRSLLAERAGFRYHTEMREMQTYSLAVAKDGPKLTVSAHAGEDSTHEISHGPGKTTAIATAATMADLASILNRELSRTVIDDTSLQGQFDLRLEWSPEFSTDSNAPSLVTALRQQLGLRLESSKGPVEIVVIDEIEKPSGN